MEIAEFTIFNPDENPSWLTRNWIMFFSWGITSLLIWIFKDTISGQWQTFAQVYFICIFGLTFYFIISSFFLYQPLHGKLTGEIKFQEMNIVVNQTIYPLSEIDNLDFELKNFYGERTSSGRDFNQMLSQGVNNFVTFTDSNNQTHLIYFKLETKNHYQVLSAFISEAIGTKKMAFNRGIDLVRIENVSIN